MLLYLVEFVILLQAGTELGAQVLVVLRLVQQGLEDSEIQLFLFKAIIIFSSC
jgi:hypothetical protein